MSITAPSHGNANGIIAAELSRIAGGKITILLVRSVTTGAVQKVIAPFRFVDALLAVGTAKLVQLTGSSVWQAKEGRQLVIP